MSKRIVYMIAFGATALVVLAMLLVGAHKRQPEVLPAAPVEEGFLHGQTVRMLIVGDPFSIALRGGSVHACRRAASRSK